MGVVPCLVYKNYIVYETKHSKIAEKMPSHICE